MQYYKNETQIANKDKQKKHISKLKLSPILKTILQFHNNHHLRNRNCVIKDKQRNRTRTACASMQSGYRLY